MKAGYIPVVGSPQPPDRSRQRVKRPKRPRAPKLTSGRSSTVKAAAKGYFTRQALKLLRRYFRLPSLPSAPNYFAMMRAKLRGPGIPKPNFKAKLRQAMRGHRPRKDFRNHGFRGTKSMSRTGRGGR